MPTKRRKPPKSKSRIAPKRKQSKTSKQRGAKPPKGFKPVIATKVQKDHYYMVLNNAIKELQDKLEHEEILEGSSLDSGIHTNRDDSIDAQLTVSGFKRGVSAQDVMKAISANTPSRGYEGSRKNPAIWVSIGFRWPMAGDDDDSRYDHFRGLNQTTGYPRFGSALQTHIADVIDMANKVRDAGWRKPTHLMFRLNWNPEKRQPKKLKKVRGHHNGGRY